MKNMENEKCVSSRLYYLRRASVMEKMEVEEKVVAKEESGYVYFKII